ncbi:sodium channel protein type 4 subunit alpha B-like, partial [Plectropomus leopardus]|uniref:sodium channel protein type 4 subunit alpha B-like n=1 Tax=Plectropomus leopardus TaxID=160734 RepID=UPI001C4B617D
LSEIFYLKSVSVLKTIPRILKIIAVSPGLRSTVRGLITLVRRLADVIMLTVFWLCVLALIGLQVFMGSLRRKCVISRWTLSDENISLTETQFDFNEYINNKVNYYYLPGQLDALLCGNSSDAG